MKLQRICAFVVLIGLFAMANMPAQPPEDGLFGPVTAHPKAGDLAPDLTFTKLLNSPNSGSWSAANLSGTTTVLVFFPLVSRNPQPIALWKAMIERFSNKPVQFVLITSEKESTLLPWLAQHPVGGWVFYDPEGQTGRSYGLEMPVDVFIGPDHRIVGFGHATDPGDRTLNAVLDGHITTTRPKSDIASVKAFLQSGLVPLDAEPPRMQSTEDHRPNFPPSNTLHVSPSKDELGTGNSTGDDFWSLQGFTLKGLIAEMYDVNPIRIVLPASLDNGKRYDFAIVLPESKSREDKRRLIQQGIQDHFQLTATREDHLSGVYVVTAPNGKPPAAKARQGADRMVSLSSSEVEFESTGSLDEMIRSGGSKQVGINALRGISINNATMEEFCHTLERNLDRPVVNETNLDGKFDFQVQTGRVPQNNFLERLRTQLHLVVTPAQRNVETLVFNPR